MRLIGFAGYARSGKDTVGQLLVDERGYRRVAFADKVKELALRVDLEVATLAAVNGGIDQAKLVSHYVRGYLQDLGQGVREVLGEDTWVRAAGLYQLAPHDRVVVTDVRFRNEADAIKHLGGKVVRINRPGTEPVNDHVSESEMDNYDRYDATIENSGSLDDLKGLVLDLEWMLFGS